LDKTIEAPIPAIPAPIMILSWNSLKREEASEKRRRKVKKQ